MGNILKENWVRERKNEQRIIILEKEMAELKELTTPKTFNISCKVDGFHFPLENNLEDRIRYELSHNSFRGHDSLCGRG
jgi:hypothetical protein